MSSRTFDRNAFTSLCLLLLGSMYCRRLFSSHIHCSPSSTSAPPLPYLKPPHHTSFPSKQLLVSTPTRPQDFATTTRTTPDTDKARALSITTTPWPQYGDSNRLMPCLRQTPSLASLPRGIAACTFSAACQPVAGATYFLPPTPSQTQNSRTPVLQRCHISSQTRQATYQVLLTVLARRPNHSQLVWFS